MQWIALWRLCSPKRLRALTYQRGWDALTGDGKRFYWVGRAAASQSERFRTLASLLLEHRELVTASMQVFLGKHWRNVLIVETRALSMEILNGRVDVRASSSVVVSVLPHARRAPRPSRCWRRCARAFALASKAT